MQFDPLNDALIKMYNAEQAGKFNVELSPASKLLGNVLEIMQKSGYVGSIDRTENGRGGTYCLRHISHKRFIINRLFNNAIFI